MRAYNGHHTIITAISVCQQRRTERGHDRDREHRPRKREEDVGDAHEYRVDPAAARAGDETDESADQHAGTDDEQRRQPRRLNAVAAPARRCRGRRRRCRRRIRRDRVRGTDRPGVADAEYGASSLAKIAMKRHRARTRTSATRSSHPMRRNISNCGRLRPRSLGSTTRERFCDRHQPTALESRVPRGAPRSGRWRSRSSRLRSRAGTRRCARRRRGEPESEQWSRSRRTRPDSAGGTNNPAAGRPGSRDHLRSGNVRCSGSGHRARASSACTDGPVPRTSLRRDRTRRSDRDT